jgi:hypothetical protein
MIWFFLITISCLFSVGLLFFRTMRPLWSKRFAGDTVGRLKELASSESDLALTSKTYLGALFFFYGIFLMLQLFDQPTPTPGILSSETPIWIRMFLLADASVWEEISGRVVLIGLPMFIYHSIQDRKGVQWKQLVGGSGTFGNGEIFFILLSSVLFGLAHLGWGPWKVIPTFVHGLLFGYLFVKVGLHASIAMHFLFDYTGFIMEIIGSPGFIFLFVLLTAFLLGGFFLGDWVNRCLRWSSRKWFRNRLKPVTLLFIHSILSMLMGAIALYNGSPEVVVILFFSIPLVDIIGFVLWKITRSDYPMTSWVFRGMVFFWSMISFAFAPFGQAWSVDPEFWGDDQSP